MKTRWMVFLFVVLMGGLTLGAQAATYELTTLGLGPNAYASDLNELGQIVGTAMQFGPGGPTYSGFVYDHGSVSYLSTFGGISTRLNAINESGQMTGTSQTPDGQYQAYFYDPAVGMIPLGVPGADTSGMGINDAGQIVGYLGAGDPFATTAFLWDGGSVALLGPGLGTDINNSSLISGATAQFIPFAPPISQATSQTFPNPAQLLGTLGGSFSYANEVNELGQIVGFAALSGDTGLNAVLFSGGTVQGLGVLEGTFSMAYGINDLGLIVGESSHAFTAAESAFAGAVPQQHAFLYDGGLMQDVNDLLAPTSAEWTVTSAYAVNNNGWIVGSAYSHRTGQMEAVLLTPLSMPVVPEPSTMLLLGLGLGGAAVRRALRRK